MHKNVTLSLPDALLRRFKVYAATKDASMSSLLAEAIRNMLDPRNDAERAKRRFLERIRNAPGHGTGGAGAKHKKSVELRTRLFDAGTGVVSVQVLSEFFAVATKKLGMPAQEVEEILSDLSSWPVHCPGHADVPRACHMHRRYKLAWRDALLLNSAMEPGCRVLWSEDFSDGHRYGRVAIRNPFV
jgi:predicted nucleic acid-binding protein